MNTEVKQAPQISGLSLLIEWANGQDHWIRKLVAEVIETRRRLTDERISSLYDLLLQEKELKAGDVVSVEPLTAGMTAEAAGTKVRLVSLRHIENVNALAANQEIEFHPRLTICFGENASGKTGYVRILKCAAAVRTAEPVLPNIHAGKSAATPRANIKVRVGEEDRTIEWHGEQGIEPVRRIDVFDARGAVVHLAEDLSYSYTPADLSLFPLVADGIERIQEKLQAAKDERQPRANPFMNRFHRESRLYAKIEGLGPSTDLQELEALAQVSDEEKTTLPGLRDKVEALRSGSIRAQIDLAQREHTVLSRALEVTETITAFNRDAYRKAVSALHSARANHERARREALAGENVPGILGDAWKNFVEAAEAYIRDIGLDPYPEGGKPCIYCRQPLGDTALSLLRKYRDYCNDALRRALEQAQERVQALCGPIRDMRLDEVQREIDGLAQALEEPSHPPQPIAIAQRVIGYVRELQQAIAAEAEFPPMPEGLDAASETLRKAAEVAKTTESDLRKQGEERERALTDAQAHLRELEVRLTLRELRPAIREHVEATRWADRAGSYLRPFQGIKRGLTETSKRASAEVMNRDFQRHFEAECTALCAPRVTLEFPGREGEARRRKLLTPQHDLREILSEGEQKVIALADFLAEASLKPERSPVVFDDPVTSLDHKRLRHVVDRIADLSRDRQVIVFTHDIWFAAELLARVEREPHECTFYDVMGEDKLIGLVARGSHPRTDTFNDRKRRITGLIDQAEKETGETRQALTEKGYEELRGCCEIVVEKDLLQGVTERYRPNVRMTVLDKIRADRLPAAVKNIVPVFEKCCRVIASHSQPLATLGIRPSLDELKDGWKTLQDVRKEYLQE